MYNYSIHEENKLFSSILQEYTLMDRINLDYSFIPRDVSNNRLQRHYKNIDSLWFSRVTGKSGTVYYFFGLKKDETLGSNDEVELKLRFNFDTEKSMSNLIFRKDKDVSLCIDIKNNDSIIRKVLAKNFKLIHFRKDPEYRYQVILGRNVKDFLENIEKLINLVEFKLNQDDKYPLVEKTIKKYKIKHKSKNDKKPQTDIIKQNENFEKSIIDENFIQKINPKVQDLFPLPVPRENQLETISEIVGAIENGYKYIILEAGTGTGKSAMAATLARMYENTFILTVTKQLQDQYVNDFKKFGFAPVKGRSNFSCRQNSNINCDKGDCILKNKDCQYNITEFNFDGNEKAFDNLYWKSENHCLYWQQKIDGLNSKVVVANYKYALYDFNFSQHFKKRKLLIMDEAHNLEDNLVDFVCLKFKLSDLKKDLGYELTKNEIKSLEIGTYNVWLDFVRDITAKYIIYHRKIIEDAKKTNDDEDYIKDLEKRLSLIDQDYERFMTYINDNPKNWVCYYNKYNEEISFKPAMVDNYAKDYLLNKGEICIFMSATILDYEKFASELGIELSKIKFIHKNSPFDSTRNPIYSKNSVDMTSSFLSENAYTAIDILKDILKKHPNDKGLIHVVSNNCKDFIMNHVEDSRLMTHTRENRDLKLEEFKQSENSVMVSPSMEEGVDLPGDECRFQIIFKMPRLPWGDKRIQTKLTFEHDWYDYRTAIRLVQIFGRGIRSNDDYCKTYVIDDTFNSFILKDKLINNFIPEYMINAIADNGFLNPKIYCNIFENNDDVDYNLDYVPKNTPPDKLSKFDSKTVEISKKLRKFKEDYSNNNFFTNEILNGIVKVVNERMDECVKNVGIVVVPSSTVERDNDSSIRKSVNTIEKKFKEDKNKVKLSKHIINCKWLLYRENDVKPSHFNEDNKPTREDHIKSIGCNLRVLLKLPEMNFILIDDITTTGTIMNACEDILIKNGVNKDNIYKFAIGKTVWWSNV